MRVGEPDRTENFEKHAGDGVCVYLEKGFPADLPKIVIQLHARWGKPRLVASRRR
ncbi:MAG: hypothetical protein ACOY40_02875 [Bacillota bacterium]